jgi:hypothetical protein
LSSPDYFTPAAIAEMIVPSDRYAVVAVAQTQELDGDRLYDAVEITFTVTGRAGAFSFVFPFVGFRAFESPIDLSSEAQIVNDLYAIAV